MEKLLTDIAVLTTGIYAQPDIVADTFYLQGNHFAEGGSLDSSIKPQLKFTDKYRRHLLQDDDLLFAAKGFNNFAIVYHSSVGRAVASSSFIVIRLKDRNQVLPEYLAWVLNNSQQVEVFHKAKAASTIPSISIGQLSKLEITVPALSVQQMVINMQQLRNKEKAAIKRLEALKDRLYKETLFKAIKKI